MTEAKAYTPIDDQLIDQQIQQYQAELEELKQAKAAALKKEEGFDQYLALLETLKRDYELTEEDIFNRRSVKIGDWITTDLPRLNKSALLARLEKFIGDRLKQQARKKPLTGRPQPARELPPGQYRHPLKLETLEKKTRAPRELNHWVTENGLETVLSWRIETSD
ncbi:hypothetical protein BGP77_06085 [Saccharospirillum sp. MSK14-1]|uniref:hypothetical protein n=1 Tax=Saccharospirillum sp. MSK14-1 TaxID=1897632 RepID=UPI000D38DF4C|nr:hypothetical protein [Saccharospirillum sp. MSK14-1]PTY36854.1 hypothetical protein BGP77_06085 [Saccharospirillum sp. MSK14-1]